MGVLTVPSTLWRWYIQYLWKYERDSWVASTASTFRILALLMVFPFIVLTLLDVASYVIARTLGDPTASTSGDKAAADAATRIAALPFSETNALPSPSIPPSSSSSSLTPGTSGLPPGSLSSPSSLSPSSSSYPPPSDSLYPQHPQSHPPPPIRTTSIDGPIPTSGQGTAQNQPQIVIQSPSSPPLSRHLHQRLSGDGIGLEGRGISRLGEAMDPYDEVTQARLAGVDLFSPAASQPGSPTLSRKGLSKEVDGEGPLREDDEEKDERGHGHGQGGQESSGDESFAMLEKDEGFEDTGIAGIGRLRQRVRPEQSGESGAADDS